MRHAWHWAQCHLGHHVPGVYLWGDRLGRPTAYCRGCRRYLTWVSDL